MVNNKRGDENRHSFLFYCKNWTRPSIIEREQSCDADLIGGNYE